MKIRINGASVRLRLSKTEVARLVHEGRVEELTPFPTGAFRYVLQKVATGAGLSASFEKDTIIMYAPQSLIRDWDTNTLISIEANMPVGEGSLYLLLEKDFQCIDHASEDQSDNYTNPKQIC